jgi:hypothetical protein
MRSRSAAPVRVVLLVLLMTALVAGLAGVALVGAAPAKADSPLALPAVQQAQLTGVDGAASDRFGLSVAISGDTAVVGANCDTVGANVNQGSAYVFTRSGATWSQQQKLTAADGAASDYFGYSVAISGDTAVVGAYYHDVVGNHDQGSACIFVFPAQTVSVTPGLHGAITPGSGPVAWGSSPTYTITPEEGYHIASLTVDGDARAIQDSWTFTNLQSAHSIAATFGIDTFGILASVVDGDGGHGTISPASAQTAAWHSTPTFTFMPEAGDQVAVVRVDGDLVTMTGVNEYTFAAIAAPHSISVEFAVDTFAMTVTAGVHGAITPGSGQVAYGSDATYTIVSAGGYHIATLTVDGAAQTPQPSWTFANVMAAHTIAATFAINMVKPHIGSMTPGTGFGATRGTAKVYFGAKAATKYVSWSKTKIKVKVPTMTKGREAVKVKTTGGVSNVKYFRRI